MDLGEKLLVLEEIIYNKAAAEMEAAEVPLSLRISVINSVLGKFEQAAYRNSLLVSLEGEAKEHTGTPEELMKFVKGGEH